MAYRILVTFGCSEGRRLLLNLLQRTPGVQVAKSADVDKSTISRWAMGERVPEYPGRRALFEEFSIPMEAWDREAAGAERADTVRGRRAA